MYSKYTIVLIATFSICNMMQASENLSEKNEPTLMTTYFHGTIKIEYNGAQLSKSKPFFLTGDIEEKHWKISGSLESLKNEKTLIRLKEAADKEDKQNKEDKQKNNYFIMHKKLLKSKIIETLKNAGFLDLNKKNR